MRLPSGEVMRFGWPEGVTPQSERMVNFWTWTVVASLIIGVIMWALLFAMLLVLGAAGIRGGFNALVSLARLTTKPSR